MGGMKLTRQGLSSTDISLDGKVIVVMKSPGLDALNNKYGCEVYSILMHNDITHRLKRLVFLFLLPLNINRTVNSIIRTWVLTNLFSFFTFKI